MVSFNDCRTRLGRLLFASTTAFLGLAFLSLSEVIYHASNPARQTYEVVGTGGFKERVELTDQRRVRLDETRKGYRLLFTPVGGIIAFLGIGMLVRAVRHRD